MLNIRFVGVCSEKAVAKVVSCTFSLANLATIAGDALRNFDGNTLPLVLKPRSNHGYKQRPNS